MELLLKGVSMAYGKKVALSDFTYHFNEGVYGLIGQNGAGKTTLLQIMAGVLRPKEGRVWINQIETNTNDLKYIKNVGYLPQEEALYPNFSVYEMMDYVSCMKKIACNKKENINNYLELVNLQDKKYTRCANLSGGMKRRLGIALALLNDPKILILDEPTTGIDITERIRFRNIISTLSENRIIIYSTHTVNDIGMIAAYGELQRPVWRSQTAAMRSERLVT
jgi:ABC-2 type transport system ATP-binding protein